MTLEELGKVFTALANQRSTRPRKQGAFATLGRRSDSNQTNSGATKGHECLCFKNPKKTHSWLPVECNILEHAITGKSARRPRHPITEAQAADIKTRLNLERWKNLRQQLEKKG